MPRARGSRALALAWAFGFAAGCSQTPRLEREQSEPPPGAHVHEPAHEQLPRQVTLTQAVIEAAGVRTAATTRAVLSATIALPGEIAADPDRSARVASPVLGRIERVAFKEGQRVERGDVLLVIRVPDLGKLRSERAATTAKAKAARANAARLERLLSQQLASEQTYLDALAQAESFEVEARASAEKLAALGLARQSGPPAELSLRAPLAGVAIRRNAVVGQPVDGAEVLAEIVDLSELWFLGRVFEKDLGRLKIDASAEVQLNAYPKERFLGAVESIGQQVDPVARTVTARVRLTNRGDLLRMGLFGTAYVSSEDEPKRTPALVVPRGALTEVAGKQVVFVRHADLHFELHEVVLGEAAAGQVEILSGLREGEQVVVEGVFTLKSAVMKSTLADEE